MFKVARSILLAGGYLFCFYGAFAQKSPIQLDAYVSWKEVEQPGLSADGKFVYYVIKNEPIKRWTLVLCSIVENWTIKFESVTDPSFSEDSHFFFATGINDTLIKFNLNTRLTSKIPNVRSYRLFTKGKKQWIGMITTTAQLKLRDLSDDKSFEFENVSDYVLSEDGEYVITQLAKNENPNPDHVVVGMNMLTGETDTIFKGNGASNFIIDSDNQQVAFTVNDSIGNSIWCYQRNKRHLIQVVNHEQILVSHGLQVTTEAHWRFSKDRKNIVFGLRGDITKPPAEVQPQIWNYKDAYLVSDFHNIPPMVYLAKADVSSGTIKQLTCNSQHILSYIESQDLFLVESSYGRESEIEWNPYAAKSYYVGSIYVDTLVPLKVNCRKPLQSLSVSPGGKFVVYYDTDDGQYYTFDILSKRMKCVSNKISNSLASIRTKYRINPQRFNVGISGWFEKDRAILINDSHDIWKVDPLGIAAPKNITQEYGRKNDVVFYRLKTDLSFPILKLNDRILLTSFDLKDKNYGFTEVRPDGSLRQIFSGPIYTGRISEIYDQPTIIKSKHNEAYLLRYEQVNNAPNYYYTRDLKKFTRISNIQPQESYNWMTSELHRYRDVTGNKCEGVLYKPENFDSSKVYPVIFNYYMSKSGELNRFEGPELTGGDINIAYLVSNGYLVFKTNISNTIGNPSEGTLNSIMGAAKHLASFKWVDTMKMAVAGHSFGGYETNLIITQTNKFCCAITASGVSDLISAYCSLTINGGNNPEGYRYGPTNLGYKLTERPDLYIKNSPIINANKVVTPLLIMHNPLDEAVNFSQSIEFFVLLRSLQKKAWLLSYSNENHAISEERNKIDYYTRMKEFLDYYLKDQPEPIWMRDQISPPANGKHVGKTEAPHVF
jgi:dipeptidyl aminopeptidase/acylaminoacyl peptidase